MTPGGGPQTTPGLSVVVASGAEAEALLVDCLPRADHCTCASKVVPIDAQRASTRRIGEAPFEDLASLSRRTLYEPGHDIVGDCQGGWEIEPDRDLARD